jgi:hypothetical protein
VRDPVRFAIPRFARHPNLFGGLRHASAEVLCHVIHAREWYSTCHILPFGCGKHNRFRGCIVG